MCFLVAQLKFHAVDLLLKIVEHGLDKEENRDELYEIFMCVPFSAGLAVSAAATAPPQCAQCFQRTLFIVLRRTSLMTNKVHHHALMGATGVALMLAQSALYRPYGTRGGTGGCLKGKALFKWAGKVSLAPALSDQPTSPKDLRRVCSLLTRGFLSAFRW